MLHSCHSIRQLHVYLPTLSSQVKEKLTHLEKYNTIINKSTRELKRFNKNKQIKYKNKYLKNAYPQYQAINIVRRQFPEATADSKIVIGPTTNEDLKYLSRTRDKRLIYSILGITGEQLRDSVLINNDVNKFLQRGQLEKALYLVKLSKNGKSATGMDSIIRYHLINLRSPKQALSLHLWRKKNDIPMTKFSYTILFDGMAKQGTPLNLKIGKSLYNIIEKLIQEGEVNPENRISFIEFNSCLNALSNCETPQYALQLFKKLNDKSSGLKDCSICKRSPLTLSYLFKAICNIKDENTFVKAFNSTVDSFSPNLKIDSQLVFQMARTLGSRTDNKNICRQSLQLLEQQFDIYDNDNDRIITTNNHVDETKDVIKLPNLNKIDTKFQINEAVAGYYMLQCSKLKFHSQGIKFIEKILIEKHPDLMDITNIHYYMQFIISQYPTTCVSKCILIFEKYLVDTPGMKHGLVLVYESFLKQSKKQYIIGNMERMTEFLSQLQKFVKKWDSQQGTNNVLLFNRKSWKFIMNVFKNIKDNVTKEIGKDNPVVNDIQLNSQYDFIIEYLNCLLYDPKFQLNSLDYRDSSSDRFIELEMIRLINDVIERNKIESYTTTSTTTTSTTTTRTTTNIEEAGKNEDPQFYLRRHLMRLKTKLMERLKILESAIHSSAKRNKLVSKPQMNKQMQGLTGDETTPLIKLVLKDIKSQMFVEKNSARVNK